MKTFLKIIVAAVLTLALMLSPVPVYANGGPPSLPQSFYGNLNLFCAPAPPGTTVEARGTGVLTGITGNPIVTTETGKYGDSGPLTAKLVVQGDIEEGAEITFWINGIQADQTAAWSSGGAVAINLTVNHAALTVEATPGGTVQKNPDESVFNCGDTAQLNAIANAHYHFVNWTGDASGTDNPLTVTINGNKSITANFAIDTFTLIYAAVANGSIAGVSTQTVAYGSNGSAVTAVPAANYHFANWSDGSTANPRTDTNVTANISVSANFAIDTFTLTYAAGANGSITGTSPQTVAYGENGTAVTAIADTGYHFVNWSDDSTANPRTDTNVTTDISVSANFAINTFTLTYTAGANGSITGISPQTVAYGATGTAVTAVADAGYVFGKWSDDSMANPRTDTNVTADISVTANFVDIWPALPQAFYGNLSLFCAPAILGTTVEAHGEGVLTGIEGNPIVTSETGKYGSTDVLDSKLIVQGKIAEGAEITFWINGIQADQTATYSSGETIELNLSVNHAVLTVGATLGGTVQKNPDKSVFNCGDTVQLTAVADTNNHFVEWSGDASGIDNPLTVTINGNKSITANFAVGTIETFTLTYTAGANGSITGMSPQTVASGSDGTAVTAVADAGYHFINWSDGSTANPRTDTNVQANISVIANFALNTPPGGDNYNLVVDSTAGGNVTTPGEGTFNYPAGTVVDLVAAANAGYHFVSWTGADVSAIDSVDSASTTITMNSNYSIIANFQKNLTLYLCPGWNILSTPVTLADECNTISEFIAFNELVTDPVSPIYSYNSQMESWVMVGADFVLSPCDAVYIKLAESGTASFIPNPTPSVTSKQLYAGWNLVSLAAYENMPVNEGLASIYVVTGDLVGYSQVVSPELCEQQYWVFTRFSDPENMPELVVGYGYWVFMINGGTLAGFTFTPS